MAGKDNAKPATKPSSSFSSLKLLFGLSFIVIIIGVLYAVNTQNTEIAERVEHLDNTEEKDLSVTEQTETPKEPKQEFENQNNIDVNPVIKQEKTFDCIKKESMFPLSTSHNPNYDQMEMMNLYRNQNKMWQVWSPPRLIQDHPNVNPIDIIKTSEEHRRYVQIGKLRITFLTSQMVRFEWSANEEYEDESTIVFSERKEYLFSSSNLPLVKLEDEKLDGSIISIKTQFLHIFYGNDKEEALKYINSPPLNPYTIKVKIFDSNNNIIDEWVPGAHNIHNLGGTVRTLDRTSGPVPLEPGLLSRGSWTFIDDTYSPLLTNIPDHDNTNGFDQWPRERNSPEYYTDWYLFGYGYDYKQCLFDFTKVAGKIPLPPKYAFGIWWSRWWNYSDKELVNLVNEFKENGVPLDNLVIDMDWHLAAYDEMNAGAVDRAGQPLGWTGYSWNYTLFECPEKFLSWCHDEGLHTTLNLHPAAGIQPHEYCYSEMAKSMDIDPNTSLHVPFDIADLKFTKNYFENVINPLEEEGIDFWWLDYQQLQVTNITNLSPTLWLNHCFFKNMERNNRLQEKCNGCSKDIKKDISNDWSLRGLIFHRWGGLGSHRYQIGFSGDTTSNWEALKFQVYFTTTASNVLFGYWSHDIGGFMSNRPTHPELFARWVQWGILSPMYRTHAWRQDYLERRIWKYPKYYFLVMKESIHLRYSLLPFLYTEARRSYDTGVSMLYPLYYDYPYQENSYEYTNEGFIGENILIAPIASPVNSNYDFLAKNSIYLPQKSMNNDDSQEWIEWNTLTSLQSGTYMRDVSIDEIPIYIRSGSIIPMNFMDDQIHNLAGVFEDPLILSIFPGISASSGSYKLYEDDGVSTNYRDENSRVYQTLFKSFPLENSQNNEKRWEIQIHPQAGDNISQRSYVIRMIGLPPPSKVLNSDGSAISFVQRNIYSSSDASFTHWSMSRDRSHYFMNENDPKTGWFYDYEHFAIVIRTPLYAHASLHSITLEWDSEVSASWDDLVQLLHSGWIGALNSINRVNLYSSGSLEELIQDCVSLPQKLSASSPLSWNLIFAEFKIHLQNFLTLGNSLLATQPSENHQNLLNTLLKHTKAKIDFLL